jgi:hypothetical protein
VKWKVGENEGEEKGKKKRGKRRSIEGDRREVKPPGGVPP